MDPRTLTVREGHQEAGDRGSHPVRFFPTTTLLTSPSDPPGLLPFVLGVVCGAPRQGKCASDREDPQPR